MSGSRDLRYWELCSVSMVNWYMFAAQDIEFRGSVALTGPNGSGKSSILDAIQSVLTGKSGRNLELNARVQTERGARRTVRDYILGALDDSSEGFSIKRDKALCYLMLGFRRTDASAEATVGLCMSARSDTPEEEVEARFLVEGRVLRCADVAEMGSDGGGTWSEARSWTAVAARLRKDKGLRLDTETGPERFVKGLCQLLRPETRLMDAAKFTRNLKNCAAFKPVSSTTEFVRNFILDGQRLNLTALRDSIARFKDIRSKIDQIKARIAEAEALADKAERVRTRARTFLHHRLTLTQGRLHLSATELAASRRDHTETVEALDILNAELPQLSSELNAASQRVDELIAMEAADKTEQAAKGSEREAAVARETAGRLRAELAALSRLAADIVQAAPFAATTDKALAVQMAGFASGGRRPVEEVAASLPGSPLALSMVEVAGILDQGVDKAARDAAQAQEAADGLQANLARAREGKRSLLKETQALLRALQDAGIEARPLCDLAVVPDAAWRTVTEAILADAREALLVEPENYDRALGILRSSGIRRAQLASTATAAAGKLARKGTLASVVKASDPRARAFLDFRLGATAMAKDEAELRRLDEAATAGMLYASGRTVGRLEAPAMLLMGPSSDPGAVAALEADTGTAMSVLHARRGTLEQLRAAHRTVSGITERIAEIDAAAVKGRLLELAQATKAAERHEADAARLQRKGGGVGAQLKAARLALAVARSLHDERRQERSKLDERLSSRLGRMAAAEVQEHKDRTRAAEVLASQGILLDPEETAAVRSWAEEELPPAPDMRRAMSDPEGRVAAGERPGDAASLDVQLDFLEFNLLDYHRKRLVNDRGNLLEEAGRYVNRHDLPQPPFVSEAAAMDAEQRFDEATGWIAGETAQLRRQVLIDYEEQAAAAHSDAIDHFRGDFVGKMRGAFEEISIRLRELNKQLAKRDFHGLTYRFDRKASIVHRDMIELVERGDAEPGFGSAGAASDPLARATRRLEEIALDPEADLSEIDDPRRYWEFDIGMDKDGVERTTMSKRLGTGSGGQVQVPYYVAICAALAATYYPDRAGTDGGLALAIFDEAFNRMDTAVIGEVVEFMHDLGLQAFIAAPDKERSTFMQFVETLVGISRVGDAVSIDVQYVKPFARARFKAENPALVGFDAYRPILEGSGTKRAGR